MACPVTSGRTEPCNDSFGGLMNMYAIPYIPNGFTVVGNEVTAIDVAITAAFKYELRSDTNTFVSDGATDTNTGTTVYTETGTLFLKKLGASTSVQLDLLHKGYHYLIFEDRNGNYILSGVDEGAYLTASNNTTGAARTDANGYNLTSTAMTKNPAPFLDSATVTALLAIVSATNINP